MRALSDYCQMFFSAHFLPIAMYDTSGFLCSAGFPTQTAPYTFVASKLASQADPAIYVSSDTGYYGLVRCRQSQNYFVLGPAYSTPVTDGFIRTYMKKNAIPPDHFEETASFLTNIPQYSYNQFANLLVYLHYTLNGEKLSITSTFHLTDTGYQEDIGTQYTNTAFEAREDHAHHGTYEFEMQMMHLIRNGEVANLQSYLLSAADLPIIREGKLAETPLRQAKNLFIGLVSCVGKYAAIPGGLDVEQTYQLIDTYIQECEKLQTEEAVKNLQYNMPIDFAKRVAQHQVPSDLSLEVYACMQYIATHINEPITVADVVKFSGKSRAFLFKKFSEELHTGIGSYINYCRIREAGSLLQYTDKSLSEISSYLCFSSQSHFQTVFKKYTEKTPQQYRTEKSTFSKPIEIEH